MISSYYYNNYCIKDYPLSEDNKCISKKYLFPIFENKFDFIFMFQLFKEYVLDLERDLFKEEGDKEEKKGYIVILKALLDLGLQRNDTNKNFNEPFLYLIKSSKINWKIKYHTFKLIDSYNLNYWIYPLYSNTDPVHLMKYIPYHPDDEFNHLLLKTIICKMNRNSFDLAKKQIQFTPELFLYKAETFLNPSSELSWESRITSDGGCLKNNSCLKSIKVMIKDNPDLLYSQDEYGNTILHYIFMSSNYENYNIQLCWLEDPQKIKIEKIKYQAQFQVYFFKEIYKFCSDHNLNLTQLFHIPNKIGSYPFEIISPTTTYFFFKEGIEKIDNQWMEMLISKVNYTLFINEWLNILSEQEVNKVINKINKFTSYITSRNELIFMHIQGKKLPLIPKDVNRYIITKMLYHQV
jgi:hypothetical protein